MISNMELLKQRIAIDGKLNMSDIIKSILKDAGDDVKRQYMNVGQRYYDGDHDVLREDFTSSWVYEDDDQGREKKSLIVNDNKSNHHNVHNYHQLLVDQKASYIAGKTPTVTVEGAEESSDLKAYENEITRYVDETFADTMIDYITGASNKGVEYLHFYIDQSSKLCYTIIPAQEVIAYYDAQYQKNLEAVIRFYSFSVVKPGGETAERKKVEWWTPQDVTYYTEDDEGNFILDPDIKRNPAPHFWNVTYLNGSATRREAQSWGRVPFVALRNNSSCSSDLTRIKGLQDAYNLLSSSSTNNQIDLVELYWMIQGYGGETARAIESKLRINKAVSITDPNGRIQAEQVTLAVGERLEWLKMLRKDIYHLGMGMDVDDETFGTAPSGVALEFKYELLDQKADQLIRKLQLAMKDFFWFLTKYINDRNGTAYDSSLVKVTVHKNKHTNEAEKINAIMASRDLVPDKLLLERHPYVDDVNEALKELKAQKEEARKDQQAMFGSPVNTPSDGGANEE